MFLSGPWWRSYFPGASLPGEREIFPEWFEVDEADQCDDVPDSVNTGKPRDLCGDVSHKQREYYK